MHTSRLGGLLLRSVLLYSLAASQVPGQSPDIASAWDRILTGSLAPAPAPSESRPKKPPNDTGDFMNHFFFESRTNYERYQTNFTGNPTNTGVINAPDTGIFNPAGIPSPAA